MLAHLKELRVARKKVGHHVHGGIALLEASLALALRRLRLLLVQHRGPEHGGQVQHGHEVAVAVVADAEQEKARADTSVAGSLAGTWPTGLNVTR